MMSKDKLKLKIERPDLEQFRGIISDITTEPKITEYVQKWFDEKVQPEVDRVNKLFNEGVTVYGFYNDCDEVPCFGAMDSDDTHKALLIDIRPIECEHEPLYIERPYGRDATIGEYVNECRHCDKKLVAEWKEVDETKE